MGIVIKHFRNSCVLRRSCEAAAPGESRLSARWAAVYTGSENALEHRRKRHLQAGFTLMELLIVMSVILILMAVAIPNYMNMRSQANETAAMEELRTLNSAEIQYQTNYPGNGFSCNLAQLGGDPKTGAPSPQAAQLIPADLASGNKSGYVFNIVNCTKVTVNNQDVYTSFEVTAVPQAVGKTGHRGFCMDQTGEIKSDPSGGTNCTQPVS